MNGLGEDFEFVALTPGSVDVSVAGEWSFAQTLRHLILATDLWLGSAVLQPTPVTGRQESADRVATP